MKTDDKLDVMKYLNSEGCWSKAKIDVLAESLGLKTNDLIIELKDFARNSTEKNVESVVEKFVDRLHERHHRAFDKRKMHISFAWEDGEVAGISRLICDCGYNKEDGDFIVRHGSIWICPSCGKKIRFIWKGMSWEEAKDGSMLND